MDKVESAAPEMRRGLPVKRPKGMPFSYTVYDRPERWRYEVDIYVDGYGDLARKVHLIGDEDLLRPGTWKPLRIGYGLGDCDSGYDSLKALENFAVALRWAVRYARRWNARHGLGEGDG